MGQYFFYTEPNKLNQQTTGVFGAKSGVGGTDQYCFTHSQDLNGGAQAIAVCTGTICLQRISGNIGTIILMPEVQPPFDFPRIQYFIYKNIDLAQFFGSAGLINGEDYPFIQKIKDQAQAGADMQSGAEELLGLSYASGHPDGIYEGTDPVDHLFYKKNDDRQLPRVQAGEAIGQFLPTGCAFEVRLQRLGHNMKLADVRIEESTLEIPSLASGATGAQIFEHWHEKDACLNYVDPVAFFGAFGETRLFYMEGGNREKTNHRDEIVTDVLATCKNVGKVYLDIRNDYGFALNYFRDRGTTADPDTGHVIRLAHRDGSSSQGLDQKIAKWPILAIELTDSGVSSSGEIKRGFFKTTLQLPQGNASVPIAYLSRAFVRRWRKLKRKEKVPLNIHDPTGDFTHPIPIAMPIAEKNGTQQFCPNYFKINFYDMDRDQTAASQTNALAPSKEHFLNGLFRPLDMEQMIGLRDDDLYFTIWHEEVLVNLAEVGGPCYVSNVGVSIDNQNYSFFAFPEYIISTPEDRKIPKSFTTWSTSTRKSEKLYIQHIYDVFEHKELAKIELDIDLIPDGITLAVIDDAFVDTSQQAFQSREDVDNYIILNLSLSEKTSLEALVAPTSSQSASSLFLSVREKSFHRDENGIRYLKQTLDAEYWEIIGVDPERKIQTIGKEIFEYGDL